MANKVIVLKNETEVLFNKSRVKFLKEDNNRKMTDDLVIRQALKNYLGVSN